MKRLAFIVCTFLCLQSSYGGNYAFSTSAGSISDLTIPWLRQGDTLRLKVTVKNTSGVAHSVKLSLSQKSGSLSKNGSPLFFEVGSELRDSLRIEMNAGESVEFTLIDIPTLYAAGHFNRYINVSEEYNDQVRAFLPITVASALTLRKKDFKDEIQVDLLDLVPGIAEYFPVYFHNDSSDAQVLTEFLSTTLPSWITVQNKYSYPLVVLPGEVVNFANIVFRVEEPNIEKLIDPVYLIYKNGPVTKRTGVRPYITSITDSALLKPCIEFFLDSQFGPIKIGTSEMNELHIKSNRPYPVRLTQPKLSWGDVEGFSFNSSIFPLDVSAFGEITLPITFAPQTTTPLVKYRYAAGFTAHAEADSSSCDPSIAFAGIAYLNDAVSVADGEKIELRIVPNPMLEKGSITVMGVEDPLIEITDILGHTAMSISSDELSVVGLANGTYIVRVSGINTDGRFTVISSLLRVMR
jgi:hypothetical protein